jgi:SOS-response transcriptional repressor LexA
MDFGKKLAALRRQTGLSQSEVAARLTAVGQPTKVPTVSKWESNTHEPAIGQLFALCKLYGIGDVLFEFTGESASQVRPSLLDGLNLRGRSHVQEYISLLEKNPYFAALPELQDDPARVIRLYGVPVSAGTGNYLGSDDYEDFEVDGTVPEDADYAVRISGDSMTPRFWDGQVIFIKEQQYVENGEIGIFSLNGDAYVKKLVGDTLVSLNPAYKPLRLREWDEFRTFGKVVG